MRTPFQYIYDCDCCCCQVASVLSDSVWPCGLQPTRLLRPWDSPGKKTGVGCHFLLQPLSYSITNINMRWIKDLTVRTVMVKLLEENRGKSFLILVLAMSFFGWDTEITWIASKNRQVGLHQGLSWWLSIKESSCSSGAAGETDSISGSGRFPGGRHNNSFQYSCQESPMGRGAWGAIVHSITKSRTQLKWLSSSSRTSN